MAHTTTITVAALAGLWAVAGCTSADPEPIETTPTSTDTVAPEPEPEPTETETEEPAPAPAADPVGTIVIDGTTYEVEGYSQGIENGEFVTLPGDFGICEATNPAFPGDANIVVKVGDLGNFGFGISDDVASADLGKSGLQEDASSVTYERVDNTITGSAEFATYGTVTFDITCK